MNDDYKEAWGVVDHNGLNVRTISNSRKAAVINWLVVEAGRFISTSHSDEHINAMWDAERGEASVKPLRVYVEH